MRALESKIVEVETTQATVEVYLALPGKNGTITRKGRNNPLREWSFKGEDLLASYLSEASVVELDDGRRIPMCNIAEISPIRVEKYVVKYELTRYRDWNLFPFCLLFGASTWDYKILDSWVPKS